MVVLEAKKQDEDGFVQGRKPRIDALVYLKMKRVFRYVYHF